MVCCTVIGFTAPNSWMHSKSAKDIALMFNTSSYLQLERSLLGRSKTYPIAGAGFVPPKPGSDIPGKLIAIGSSTFIRNHSLAKYGHQELFRTLIGYLGNNTFFQAKGAPDQSPRGLYIDNAAAVWLLLGLCFLYPFVYLIAGLFTRKLRNRR